MQAEPVETEAAYRALARVVGAFGTASFYAHLSEFAALALGCTQRLVMRYPAFDRPAFLFNNCMSDDAVAFYMRGLYRLDPLRKLAQQRGEASVVHLRALSGERPAEADYLEEIFKIAFIYDELAFMLPTVGGLAIAVCCEKQDEPFTEADRRRADAMLPLMRQLHQKHLHEVFADRSAGVGDDLTGAICVLDAQGEPVFISDGWTSNAHIDAAALDRAREARTAGEAYLRLGDDFLIHWEALGPDSQLAPGGVVFTAEERSEQSVSTSFAQAIDQFCDKHAITPREAEIFRLALLGFPNLGIAKRLGISVGTVKNHRWRLYTKLDITTERELFRLFLADVITLD